MSDWTVAQAKAKLSEVIENARAQGPQTITRNGRKTAVLVSVEEWERKTKRKESLVDFLNRSPLRGLDIDLERVKDKPRDIDL
jgi:prevent-host-death family protein